MRLLILGYGSVVRRRVLPAARASAAFDAISVASRSHGAARPEEGVAWYTDYGDALAASGADLVYVSGVNSGHHEWIVRSLDRGCHVMVDKPAVPDAATAEAVVALARQRRRGIAEATVFAFHPQVARITALIAGDDPASTRVTAVFSVPPLPPADFRYRGDCGGGCLSDLGPYAVATNRLVFGEAPDDVSCRVLTRAAGVDTSFSVLMTHRSGASIAGHFGFVTAYQNRWSLLTDRRTVDVDRIFTTPPAVQGTARVGDDAGERLVALPAADAFVEFMRAFTCAVTRGGDFGPFESALLADAALLDRLRGAAARP